MVALPTAADARVVANRPVHAKWLGIPGPLLGDFVEHLRSSWARSSAFRGRGLNRQGVNQGVKPYFCLRLSAALETPCTTERLTETL